ncbi:MAG: hypothetical protein JWN67_13 [Actinomycetia bacterium]|nr:hypothetical protein [Actinomycetes bacterium]
MLAVLAAGLVAPSACSEGSEPVATPVTRRRPDTPAAALREVVAFLEAHPRMRVTGSSDSEHGDAAVGDDVADVHEELDADLVLPDRSSMSSDNGYSSYEERTVDGHYFWRVDDEATWVSDRFDPGNHDLGLSGAYAGLQGLVGALGAPMALGTALDGLHDVERLRAGRLRGTTTLRSLLPPVAVRAAEEMVAPADGSDILDATVVATLDHGTSGRPRRLELELVGTLRGKAYREHLTIRFVEWGSDIEVTAPNGFEIDETPYVDEPGLAAIEPPLPAPTDLPPGWFLSESDIEPEDAPARRCTQVYLDYAPYHRVRGVEEKVEDAAGNPIQAELAFIADCPYDGFHIDWTGATRLGPYESVPVDFPEDTWFADDLHGPAVAIRLGYWTLLLRTNAGPEVRLRLVSSLAPFPDQSA